MNRKERRALAHQERKLARKLGFPQAVPVPTPTQLVEDQPHHSTLNVPEPGFPFPPLSSLMPKSPVSEKQTAANRANAQHSCGPKSEAGRAASSQNHTIHGLTRHNGEFRLLESETLADFTEFKGALIAEHNPQTVTEGILVNSMAESHWLANRAQSLIRLCQDSQTGEITDEKRFSLYSRYHTTHTRAFSKALNDLLKLRKQKQTAENGFEAQKRKELELRIKSEQHEMKKQKHYWDVMRKDGEACNRLTLNLLQKMKAREENPGFDAAYEAELAKFGLVNSTLNVATAA